MVKCKVTIEALYRERARNVDYLAGFWEIQSKKEGELGNTTMETKTVGKGNLENGVKDRKVGSGTLTENISEEEKLLKGTLTKTESSNESSKGNAKEKFFPWLINSSAEVHKVGTLCRYRIVGTKNLAAAVVIELTGLGRLTLLDGKAPTPNHFLMQHFHQSKLADTNALGEYLVTIFRRIYEIDLHGIRSVVMKMENDDPFLPDVIITYLNRNLQFIQEFLETFDLNERYKKTIECLNDNVKVLERMRSEMGVSSTLDIEKSEQQVVLSSLYEAIGNLIEQGGVSKTQKKFMERLSNKIVPPDAREFINSLVVKLSYLSKSDKDDGTLEHLNVLTSIPWGIYSEDNYDVKYAEDLLNKEHFGLEIVKQKVLEFVAVGKLRKNLSNGKIFCLVGPPGVGKTSIARSVANALKRKFYRIALGGSGDPHELKGHRRTYIASMPGKIIAALISTQTSNPVILIDEIDKVSNVTGSNGNLATTLLEILDPEQNKSFVDSFVDVPVDLSKVLFICTANSTDCLTAPLADRMEFLELKSYALDEKIEIARKYLIPTALENTGVAAAKVDFPDDVLSYLIDNFCPEAGVRSLQSRLESIFRQAALNWIRKDKAEHLNSEQLKISVTKESLKKIASWQFFEPTQVVGQNLPGLGCGLSVCASYGSVTMIEVVCTKLNDSTGTIKMSGSIQDVLKESVHVAYSMVQSFLLKIDPTNTFFSTSTLHIHFPSGSTHKDGTSAGIAIATALLSLALNVGTIPFLAMTGEITLQGKVLEVGAIKEKIMGAKRSRIETVILPATNRKEWDELSDYLKQGIKAHFVSYYDEVFNLAFPAWLVTAANESIQRTRKVALDTQKSAKRENGGANFHLKIPPRIIYIGSHPDKVNYYLDGQRPDASGAL